MREERLWSTPLHYAFTYSRREVPLHVAPKAQSLPSAHSVTLKQGLRKKEPFALPWFFSPAQAVPSFAGGRRVSGVSGLPAPPVGRPGPVSRSLRHLESKILGPLELCPALGPFWKNILGPKAHIRHFTLCPGVRYSSLSGKPLKPPLTQRAWA